MPVQFNVIKVTSGYGGNTRQPFVEIKTDKLKEPLQLSPEEARDLALNLLEAAESCEQDAFIFEFFSHIMGGGDKGDHAGAKSLIEFRQWRDDHGQNK